MGVLLVISVGNGFFNEMFHIFRASPCLHEDSFYLGNRLSPALDWTGVRSHLCRHIPQESWYCVEHLSLATKKEKQPKGKHFCQRLCHRDTPPAPKMLRLRSGLWRILWRDLQSSFCGSFLHPEQDISICGAEPKRFCFLGLCPMPWGCIAVKAAFKSLSLSLLL